MQACPAGRTWHPAPGSQRPGKVRAARHEEQHLGVQVPDRVPGRTRRSLAIATEQVPATGPPDLLRNPTARRERWIEPLQRDDAGRRMACGPPRENDFLDVGQALAEDLDEAQRLVLGRGHGTDRGNRVKDALDGRRRERHDGWRTVAGSRRLTGVGRPWTSRAPWPRHEDEVGPKLRHQRVVHLQARGSRTGAGVRGPRDNAWAGRVRDLARVRDAHEVVCEPQRANDLRGCGEKRDDAHRAPGTERPAARIGGRSGCRGGALAARRCVRTVGRPSGPTRQAGFSVSSMARAAALSVNHSALSGVYCAHPAGNDSSV